MIIESEKLVPNPKVTVVIATYNQSKYIENTVKSVIKQETSFPFEILICDDGSNDGTREILSNLQKQYPTQVRLIFNEVNLMVTRNYVNAICNANGEYIATMDGDDFYNVNNALQTLCSYLDSHRDVSLVHAGFRAFNEDNKTLFVRDEWSSPMQSTMGIDGVYCLITDQMSHYPLGSTSCFRKSYYLEGVKLYPEIIEASAYYGEATILNVSMLMKGVIGFAPSVITSYRVLKKSLCHFETNLEVFEFEKKYLFVKITVARSIGLDEDRYYKLIYSLDNRIRKVALRYDVLPQYFGLINHLSQTENNIRTRQIWDRNLGVVHKGLYYITAKVIHLLKSIKKTF